MKVRTMILEKDKKYLMRFSNYVSIQYSDKIELFAFSDAESAAEYLKSNQADVALIDDTIGFCMEDIPDHTMKAYFTTANTVSSIHEIPAICKFQKADDICQWIIEQYAERISSVVGFAAEKAENVKLILFCGYGSASGTTSVSLAFSQFLASRDKRVLYLNMEPFSSVSSFFNETKNGGLSDFLYALKSKKSNLLLKAEHLTEEHASGFSYVGTFAHSMDLKECTEEDIKRTIESFSAASHCEYLIVDTDYSALSFFNELLKQSFRIVLVNDGREASNSKLLNIWDMMTIVEKEQQILIKEKSRVLYNKFSSKASDMIELGMKNIGGHPYIQHADFKTIVNALEKSDVMYQLLEECGESI